MYVLITIQNLAYQCSCMIAVHGHHIYSDIRVLKKNQCKLHNILLINIIIYLYMYVMGRSLAFIATVLFGIYSTINAE